MKGICVRFALVLSPLVLMVSACSSPVSSGVRAPAATAPAISKAYDIVFNLANSIVSTKVGDIQDGQTLQRALTTAINSSLAASAQGAAVSKVSLHSSSSCGSVNLPWPCAKVTYQILGDSGGSISGETGYAVFVNGKWLVAKATACGVLNLMYWAESRSKHAPGCR